MTKPRNQKAIVVVLAIHARGEEILQMAEHIIVMESATAARVRDMRARGGEVSRTWGDCTNKDEISPPLVLSKPGNTAFVPTQRHDAVLSLRRVACHSERHWQLRISQKKEARSEGAGGSADGSGG